MLNGHENSIARLPSASGVEVEDCWHSIIFQAGGFASADETSLFKVVSTKSGVVACQEAFSLHCVDPHSPFFSGSLGNLKWR